MVDIIHQCFRKVRVGTKSTLSKEIENLLSQKTKLKIFLAGNISNLEEETKTREKLQTIEENLSNLTSSRNVKIVNDHVQNLQTL